MNKNVSVWRGVLTPPTNTHIWIKDDNSILVNRNGLWVSVVGNATEQQSGYMSKTDKLILNMLNINMHWK